MKCRATHQFSARSQDELSFEKGDLITVFEKNDDGWWKGELRGNIGLFPGNFTCEI